MMASSVDSRYWENVSTSVTCEGAKVEPTRHELQLQDVLLRGPVSQTVDPSMAVGVWQPALPRFTNW